jgi:dUTP pyrophosphatase
MGMESTLTEKIKLATQLVEKFVEENIIEKNQRDENLKKLAGAFDVLLKDNPLRQAGAQALSHAADLTRAGAAGFAAAAQAARGAEASQHSNEAAEGVDVSSGNQKSNMSWVRNVKLRVKPLTNFKGELPKYQSPGSSGMDVRAQLNEKIVVMPGARVLVPTGLAMAVPFGYEIQARPRSGYAIRDGMTVLNTPGTIDADYRGEVKIVLINLGDKVVEINDQDRVAQLVVCPIVTATIEQVSDLDATERGAGGFGSTGKA